MNRQLPRLTVADAAHIARTSTENVSAALASGDLRDLTRQAVLVWARARTASSITDSLGPDATA